jgi:deoxyribonuclease-4
VQIGCHISVARGFLAAVDKAHALQADGLQYFTKSPRMLRFSKKLDEKDAQAGKLRQQELGLVSIGHAPYLINLSSPDDEMRRASIEALRWDLVVGHARGSLGVVVHCGKHMNTGVDAGIVRMRESLKMALEDAPATPLLLENTAGQGSELGYTVEQLLELVEGIAPPDRLGFCLDTQHAFAAGILNTEDPDAFVGFHSPAFMERLKAVHLNDSKVEFGHRADRHAPIGQGFMGRDGMRRLLTTAALQTVPMFLETPVDDEDQYADEIRVCRELVAG